MWKYNSIEDVAQEIIKDLNDENKIIGNFKIVIQEPKKKCKKRRKK